MDTVALLADVGESFGQYVMGEDTALFEFITDANIACGFHAGDPMVMEATVTACRERGIGIGAHPGYRDLVGFGRRAIAMTGDEVRTDVLYQLGALGAFALAQSVPLHHVTVHGHMDNAAVSDPVYAAAIADAIASYDQNLVVVTQTGELERAARERGLPVAYVFMADRAYEDNGEAVSRRLPGAVLHDPDEITARTIRAVTEGVVASVNGVDLPIRCDVVLLHGDNAEAIEVSRRLRNGLEGAGVEPTSLAADPGRYTASVVARP